MLQKIQTEEQLREALIRSGEVATYWLEFVQGAASDLGGKVIAIGRVLRASPEEPLRQYATEQLVDFFESSSGTSIATSSLSYPDELCREGIIDARDKHSNYNPMTLIIGRDDLESLRKATNVALEEQPSLFKKTGIAQYVESLQSTIKRIDARINFMVPHDSLLRESQALSSPEYVHLRMLSEKEPQHWWLQFG